MLALSVQPQFSFLFKRGRVLVVEYQDNDLIHPAVGMEFSSSDEGLFLSNDYAKRLGFG